MVSNSIGWYVVVKIVGGKTYSISRKNGKEVNSNLQLGACTTINFPQNNTVILDNWRTDTQNNSKKLNIETSKNAKYLFIGLAGGNTTTITEEIQKIATENLIVKIEEQTTDYIEHQQTDYLLYIQQEMLQGDYFVKEEDGWKEFHNWNKKELTGNENIALEETYNGIAQFCIKDITNAKWNNDRHTINAYSNYFKAVAFTDSWKKDEVVTITGGKTVRFMSSKYTTVAEFKQFLQEKYTEGNPVVVYYKLETLEELSCTEEQSAVLDELNNLDLFEGVNNIITAENIAKLKLKYVADTKTYVDNQVNERLSNIENQIINLSGGN